MAISRSSSAGNHEPCSTPPPISVVTPQFLQDTAVVQAQATSATFRIPVATDLPSDNAPHKIGVATFDLTTDSSYPNDVPVTGLE